MPARPMAGERTMNSNAAGLLIHTLCIEASLSLRPEAEPWRLMQAAKQERRRQYQAAERERKSKTKSAAELAQEQREQQVKQKQQVKLLLCS